MRDRCRQQARFPVASIVAALCLALAACSGGDDSGVKAAAGLTVDNITADDIVNAAEAAGDIEITGSVEGIAVAGGIVGFTVNGTAYTGMVGAGNRFSITVSGMDLVFDTRFEVTVAGLDNAENPYTATAVSTHGVDIVAAATIAVDSVTADNTVNAAEAAGDIPISGRVGGDAAAGDVVSLVVNGIGYSGVVDADNTFSIAVAGSDLQNDSSFEVSVDGSDDAGNPFTATTTSTHSIDLVAMASISVDSITYDRLLADTKTSGLVNVTGTVGGDATAGDLVSFKVYFTDYSGLVLAGNTFSIPVFGYDLSNEDSFDITVEGSDSAGNPFNATATSPILHR